MTIGDSGFGMLTISGGGTVNDWVGNIAAKAGSSGTVLVTGAGSQWNNSVGLAVGFGGPGTLTIQNGGVVGGGSAIGIGGNPNSVSTVSVDGVG
ncbi:MAG: autotransporter outer membrane beta-barrel domain-containing protein, partial [Bryobacteraceae bacterium]